MTESNRQAIEGCQHNGYCEWCQSDELQHRIDALRDDAMAIDKARQRNRDGMSIHAVQALLDAADALDAEAERLEQEQT
jgi:hypothetical protein|tara:strand:- start:1712 stop:1948 length:237 start_codon:yes stop_codon:yes gene_type:complete